MRVRNVQSASWGGLEERGEDRLRGGGIDLLLQKQKRKVVCHPLREPTPSRRRRRGNAEKAASCPRPALRREEEFVPFHARGYMTRKRKERGRMSLNSSTNTARWKGEGKNLLSRRRGEDLEGREGGKSGCNPYSLFIGSGKRRRRTIDSVSPRPKTPELRRGRGRLK